MALIKKLVSFVVVCIALGFTMPTFAEGKVSIKYAIRGDSLTATIDEKIYTITSLDAYEFTSDAVNPENPGERSRDYSLIRIDKVGDFDGNGLADVLFDVAQTGNCCGPVYKIASIYPDGTSNVSKEGFSSWDEPKIEKINKQTVFKVDYKGQHSEFIYKNNDLITTRSGAVPKLYALKEVSLKDFDGLEYPNDQISFNYDLNSDGKKEKISCVSGRLIRCDITDKQGKVLFGNFLCARYGILPAKTNGWHDLVCDENLVIRYSNSKYRVVVEGNAQR
jgi:hypothetical protein